MNTDKREKIRHTLRCLAESQSATIDLMDQTLVLLSEELALDPFTFWKSRPSPRESGTASDRLNIDRELLTVTYSSRSCFLGNTLSFRLIARLARRPNAYFTYEELLSDVWCGLRTDSAVRAAVKRLRGRLRRLGMMELADALDGSVPGRYALKLGD